MSGSIEKTLAHQGVKESADDSPSLDINKLLIEDIDPKGDLILHVGADPGLTIRTYRVDSLTLRRGSVVFKAMLFGPWVESKPAGQPWVVSLPDDNPDAFETILLVAHCQSSKLPKEPIGVDRFYDLLVVCDKYKMTALIPPWERWWSGFVINLLTPSPYLDVLIPCPKKVFMAWELGQLDIFRDQIYYLVETSTLSRDKRTLMYCDGRGNETPLCQYRLGPFDMEGM